MRDRRQWEADLGDELLNHIDLRTRDLVATGLAPEEAARRARLELGSRERYREEVREAAGLRYVEEFRQDLLWTWRSLRKASGFAVSAILIAALGIGASACAFNLLDQALLRPLPFPEPDRLVALFQIFRPGGNAKDPFSPANFNDYKAQTGDYTSLFAYSSLSINLSSDTSDPHSNAGEMEPVRLDGANVQAAMFDTLRVAPTRGRAFSQEDERNGAPGVVILSDTLWRGAFAADLRIIGRVLRLDGDPYTVVGVMPPDFNFPSREARLWLPLRVPPGPSAEDRSNLYLRAIGRLRPSASVAMAQASASVVATRLERDFPKDNGGFGAAVVPLRDTVSTQSKELVWVVFGAALCLLLVSNLNQGNLLIARAVARRREMAIRSSLGAGRGRLLRQLATENLVVSGLGGVIGLVLAAATAPLLARLVPDALPLSGILGWNPRMAFFAIAVSAATGLLLAVLLSIRASRHSDSDALRGRSASGLRSERLRSTLVLAEVAGTVVLLVAAGLLVKAMKRVENVDPGFDASDVLTMRTVLPQPRYAATSERARFYDRVLTAARSLPGVSSAGYISFLPMVNRSGIWPAVVPGLSPDEALKARFSLRFVTPDFFKTLRVPIRDGRDISARDTWDAPFSAVVSESFVRRFLKGRPAVGEKFEIAFFPRTIVGVVGDIAVRGLESDSEPQVYLSALQVPNGGVPWYSPKDLVVRSTGNLDVLASSLRRIIRDADPAQPVSDVQTLRSIVESETSSRRIQAQALGVFALLAFGLAAIGIHGLLSYAVASRISEVAVRLALGAGQGRVLGVFLGQGAMLGLVGVFIALPLAYVSASALRPLLFGVSQADPITYTAAAVTALVMTILGSLPPALRASRLDPACAMRADQ